MIRVGGNVMTTNDWLPSEESREGMKKERLADLSKTLLVDVHSVYISIDEGE